MRRILVLAALAFAGAALVRRLSARRPHGTPDTWPAVPRRPAG